RREEKNFIIYLDSLHIEQALMIITQIESNVEQAKNAAPQQTAILDSITMHLTEYKKDISVLATTFQDDPRALSALQRQLVDYEENLRRTISRTRAKDDTIPAWLSDLNVLMVAATTKLSTEKARLLTNLRETTTSIINLATRIVTQAQADLAKHSEEGVHYGLRAQRNTLTIFIVTLLLLAYLIAYFPNIVLLPFQRITKTLKAISKGDSEFRLTTVEKAGEFGELYNSFQDAIHRLILYNDLKTDRIVELQSQFRSILEEVKEACIILSYDLRVELINDAAVKLLALEGDAVGRNVSELPSLWKILEGPLRESEHQRRTEITARIKKTDIRKRIITLLSFRHKGSEAATRVVIIK
ncbi:MAG: hypothetical protein JSU64_01390, partial [candidate division WOR-3 bacterium]